MAESDGSGSEYKLSPGAERLIRSVEDLNSGEDRNPLGLNHWVLALLTRHGLMAEDLVKGLDPSGRKRELYTQIADKNLGPPLPRDVVVTEAWKIALDNARHQVNERDLALVILKEAGYEFKEEEMKAKGEGDSILTQENNSDKGEDKYTSDDGTSPDTDLAKPSAVYIPRSSKKTPVLDRYGRDLTKDAVSGMISPILGRDAEIRMILETLCRKTKRNPVLVGNAGVGKTAIVEGFAVRVGKGDVPPLLQGVRVITVQPSSLSAGATYSGEFEKRMKDLLEEAKQDGIILFIDEVHSIVGAGGRAGSTDFASLLKPALAREDVACIAATTSEEYRRYIEPDAALERRFQPVYVSELPPGETLVILTSLRDEFARARGVRVADEGLQWLVDFAGSYLRNRNFPDKGVDLLEQTVAWGTTQGKSEIGIPEAMEVARRMVGMPLDPEERLEALRKKLREDAILDEDTIEKLLTRLAITSKELDLRHQRPNGVILLCGEASGRSSRLSEAIAEACFGSLDRVISIDFSRFVQPEFFTMLLGSPPSYVGYDAPILLHRVLRMPWCVLRFENIHACHPHFIEILSEAIEEGFFTDSMGKKIFISDTIMILTAEKLTEDRRPLGFHAVEEESPSDLRTVARERFGAGLIDLVDLICGSVPMSGERAGEWVERNLLPDLAERFRKHGVNLVWDESVARWLEGKRGEQENLRDLERLVDDQISSAVLRSIGDVGRSRGTEVLVRCVDGKVEVRNKPPKREEG